MQFKKVTKLLFISLFIILILVAQSWAAATYYVDATNGNDSWDGLAPEYMSGNNGPWETISKVNASSFNPGESILFKRDESWYEVLTPPSSGTPVGGYITFGAYGTGTNPKIYRTNKITSWPRWSQICHDPSFECYADGSSNDDWYNWAELSYPDGTIQADSTVVWSGQVSAKLTPGSGYNRLYKNVYSRLAPSTQYFITVTGRITSEGDLLRCQLWDKTNGQYLDSDGSWTASGVSFADFSRETPGTWVTKTLTFTTNAGVSESIIYIWNQGPNPVWIDNVAIYEGSSMPASPAVYYGSNHQTYHFGAVEDGDRLPVAARSTYNGDTIFNLTDGYFSSWDYYFYHRDDSTEPTNLDVGFRKAGIYVDSKNYLKIENIDVYGPGGDPSSNQASNPAAVHIGGTSDHIYYSGGTVSNADMVGVQSGKATSYVYYNNLTVYGSSSTNIYANSSDGAVTNCHAYNAGQVVTDGFTSDAGGIGIQGNNLLIEGNVCHDNSPASKSADFEISSVGSTGPNTITRNLIYNAYQGGIQIAEGGDGSEIYNNIILGFGTCTVGGSEGKYAGIRIGGGVGGAGDVKIYNNVISGGGSSQWHNVGLYVGGYDDNYGLSLKNNIFYENSCMDVYVHSSAWTINYDFMHNCYYKTDFTDNWNWKGMKCSTLADWRTASGMGEKSRDFNPNFKNPGVKDFRLNTGSLCIEAGINVDLDKDFLGNRWRRPNPSMGAIEYYQIGGLISPRKIGGSHYAPVN